MTTFNVALLQMSSAGRDQQANLEKGDQFCRWAKRIGADLALFPEMWNIGYSPISWERDPFGVLRPEGGWLTIGESEDEIAARERAAWQAEAVDTDGPFVRHFRDLARELDLAIALTYLQRWSGAPRNVVSVIDRHGEIILTYAKVHTCDFSEAEAATTPGETFPVASLDTASGPVNVGAMICYDREFPESARILMLQGAEIILTPNACDLEANRLGQFRTRAFENMVGVAMANYAAPEQNGHSVAYHPVAFRDGRSRDTLVIEAGDSEGVFLAPFDVDDIRAYREREIWGNAFRRPHRYGQLTAPAVNPPFQRITRDGARYLPGSR